MQTAQEDTVTNFYHRRHPAYDGLLAHWILCEKSYEGGPDWFEKNLFKYVKEGTQEFKERKARAMRINHTREAVDLVQKYLFKSAIKRDVEGVDDHLKKFWARSTRSGQGIDELMRLVSTSNSLTGRVALVIDSSIKAPVKGEGDDAEPAVLSIKEAEESNGRIYAYVVAPRDILDYAWSEEDGELLWIKIREFYRDDKDPILGTGDTYERVRLWTRTEWQLYEAYEDETAKPGNKKQKPKAKLIDQGRHDLGRVPVKLCDHSVTDHPFRASGLVDDIVYMDRAISNYMSNVDAIIQDQTFSQLAIPSQALPGDKKTAAAHLMEMGTKRIFTYDGGAGSTAKPEFISPDPKQAGVITSTINMLVTQIYSTIGLAGERTKQDNAMGIDNSSGVAKAYDFERVNALLLSKAKRLETVENWIVETVNLWAGETQPKEPVVTYPTSFDVASLGDELVTAEALQKIRAPIEIRREHMKEITAKLFPQVTTKKFEELMKAIEAWEDQEVLAAEASIKQTEASTKATEVGAEVAKNAAGQPATAKSGDKPVAAKSRQGSVTSETKSIPKNAAK